MIGVEIDFVVSDCIQALALYEKIFDIETVEVTNYARGFNEAVFTMYGTRFHMLDENPEYQLVGPHPGNPQPMWINVLVPDIGRTYETAISLGGTEILGVTKMDALGISNALFSCPFGYVWMLHQVHRAVSQKERHATLEAMLKKSRRKRRRMRREHVNEARPGYAEYYAEEKTDAEEHR